MTDRYELVVRNTDRTSVVKAGQILKVRRTAECDPQIDDPSDSRRHCTIAFEHGVLRVQDLDPENGTFINERPIKVATARVGDLSRLGAAIIEFRDPAAAPETPA